MKEEIAKQARKYLQCINLRLGINYNYTDNERLILSDYSHLNAFMCTKETGIEYNNVNSYDVNKMYASLLVSKEFPTDKTLPKYKKVNYNSIYELESNESLEDKLYLVAFSFSNYKRKLPLYYETYFHDKQEKIVDKMGNIKIKHVLPYDVVNGKYVLRMNCISFRVFCKLYDIENLDIYRIYVFKNKSKISENCVNYIKEIVNEINNIRDSREKEIKKRALEMAIFGKQVARNYGKMQKFDGKKFVNMNFCLGMWLPSYGQEFLLNEVLKHINNVVYCDTDSIYLGNSDKLDDFLVDNKELGKFKMENENITLLIDSIKNYRKIYLDGSFIDVGKPFQRRENDLNGLLIYEGTCGEINKKKEFLRQYPF